MHGNLDALPPTRIHVGSDEVLYPQVVEFADKLTAAGVDVSLVEYARLWHVAHAQASLVTEAADAVADLGQFLESHGAKAATIQPMRPVTDGCPTRIAPPLRRRLPASDLVDHRGEVCRGQFTRNDAESLDCGITQCAGPKQWNDVLRSQDVIRIGQHCDSG